MAAGFIGSGCASIIRSDPPSVQIVGPSQINVRNTHGQAVHLIPDDEGALAFPEKGRDDSLVISYGGVHHTVGLARRVSPWVLLDLFSMGPGFAIDDMSQWWYSYTPVYVHPDSTGKDFSLSSSNWLGESAGKKRPELLLLGGFGMWLHIFFLPGEAALAGPLPKFFTKFQGGFGVDLYKTVEVFYLAQDDPSYNVNNSLADLGIPNLFTDVTSQSIAARYFFKDHWFVQGSMGYGQIEVDTFGSQTSNNNLSYQLFSNRFPVLGGGVGWAGDISYIALQYAQASKQYFVDGASGTYHSIFLDFGLNLRF